MAKIEKTANNDKSGRVVRETTKEGFMRTVNQVIDLVSNPDFIGAVCERTENGKYKVTDTKPLNMDGVKTFDKDGVTWYLVPTTDDKTAIATYIRYRLNREKAARQNALKALAGLTTEELLAMAAQLAK